MIPTYKYEVEAGIDGAIKANNSLACVCQIVSPKNELSEQDIKLALAKSTEPNLKSGDLYYFNSILASTGWNKNDDVFSAQELWKAKSTPVDKKINIMHDENVIVGHMVSSKVCNQEGIEIEDNTPEETLPYKLDVVVGGVLYSIWESPERQAQMNDILAKIENDEMFVSMECLFNNFDYAVVTPNGEDKVIARSEETAFLSKHLRAYGGLGEYQGHKIGRLLKSFVFSGKGLVDNPANPRSFILKDFDETTASVNLLNITENIMTISQEKYDLVVAKLEQAEASVKSNDSVVAEYKSMLEKLQSENEAAIQSANLSKEVAKANEDQIAKLQSQIESLQSELTSATSQLESFKREALKASRLSMFNEVDVDLAKANDLVEKFIAVSDEMFQELVLAMPKKMMKKAEDKMDKEKEDEMEMKKKKSMSSEASALENVETETQVVSTVVHDETETVRSKACEWLSSLMKSKAAKGDN